MPDQAFPYPGGKARMADAIIGLLPDHECYVEPFGGGAAVLLQKPRSDVEVYNDVNGNLVAFFEVARDDPEELIRWVESTPYSRELCERYGREVYAGDFDDTFEQAAKTFYVRNSSFGGKVHRDKTNIGVAFKPPQVDGDSWRDFADEHDRKVSRIGAISDRLSGVTIERMDWSDVVDKYDSPTTVFYFDPPYVGEEKYYGSDFDHDDFTDTIASIDGEWVLSYGDTIPDGVDATPVHDSTVGRAIGNNRDDDGPGKGGAMKERIFTSFDPDDATPFAGKDQAGVDEFL